MELTTEDLLSPRIHKHCLPLWQDGYYKHAAHEAMIQVEQALKGKELGSAERQEIWSHPHYQFV